MSEFVPAERVRGVKAYAPPVVDARVDVRLDANEGARCGASVLAALRSVDAETLRRYPDAGALEAELAAGLGVATERVVVTNGGDDAIDRLCRAVLEPGRVLVAHTPTFEMIGRSAELAGAGVRGVEWFDGAFPVEEMLGLIDGSTGLVSLVSPNNPTGGVIKIDDVRRVVRAAAGVGALVLVDLAYVEFAEADPTGVLLAEPNVVIVRTFSKAMGLAGVRVGYAAASAEVAGWLRAAGGPYPVASVSLALASAALRAKEEREAFIAQVRSERARLVEELTRLGCRPMATEANFVTARVGDAPGVLARLASLGIAVRDFGAKPGLEGLLRITLPGDENIFDRLVGALRAAVRAEAVLFDMDGVLADVSASYNSAIVETARSFGVEVTNDDILKEKRAGDANNDWVLTQRLVVARGNEATLDDVRERFQRLYLGTDDEPGLRERESLIPSVALLRSLASRVRLAVVTGRPSDEAAWFIERAGLSDVFETVVCMEDAEPKPSAAPVRLAMERLGVSSAWMIGDTPDDVAAARAAGVVGIGVVAPGDDLAGSGLVESGAACVLGDLSELEEMLA